MSTARFTTPILASAFCAAKKEKYTDVSTSYIYIKTTKFVFTLVVRCRISFLGGGFAWIWVIKTEKRLKNTADESKNTVFFMILSHF
jgi:hypothetical protein